MNTLLSKIIIRPIQFSFFMWSLLLIVVIYLNKEFSADSFVFVFNLYAYYIILFFNLSSLQRSRAFTYLRQNSSSIVSFWLNTALILILLTTINLFFLFIALKLSHTVHSLTSLLPIYDFLWIYLFTTLFTIFFVSDPLKNQTAFNSSQFLKGLLKFGLILTMFFVTLLLYKRSHLLVYFLLCLTCWIAFTRFNAYFKNSFSLDRQNKILKLGILFLSSLVALNLIIEKSLSLAPQFVWNSTQKNELNWIHMLESKTPKDWTNWYLGSTKKFTAAEATSALEKLQMLCPYEPSDDLRFILCASDEDMDFIHLFHQNWTEEDIVYFLNSKSYYARLLGVLEARNLPHPLSEKIRNSIMSLKNEGSIQPAAEKTLKDNHKQNTRLILRFMRLITSEP